MHVDFIIVGQGISGTFLSYYLFKSKKSFLVVDNNDPNTPSRVAAGLINPVTGRRMVTVWMADEVLPFAWNAYTEIGNELDISAISHSDIIDFFPNPFMRENFLKRLGEGNTYTQTIPNEDQFTHAFNYEFGCGRIKPVYIAHVEKILPAWRQKLKRDDLLLEEDFESGKLEVANGSIRWQDRNGRMITAEKIIFCDGANGFNNPYFKDLPFALNKGEALIVEIPGLDSDHIYKKSMTLAPLQKGSNLFWLGSNYSWEFADANPTAEFRDNAEYLLKEWLKMPYTIVGHNSAVRPATVERRPFAGFHPQQKNIGILNGMGTKGCSLAPFFARQLVNHMLFDEPVTADADIARFKRILSKKIQ